VPSADCQHLQRAFAIFSQASEQLSGAYQELQDQVTQLSRELAIANGELRRQLAEKEALSRRLGTLLDALPGGVVALSARGRVEEVNPAAVAILGEPLLGLPWCVVAEDRLLRTGVACEWHLKRAEAGEIRRVRIDSSAPDPEERRILLIHDVTGIHAMQERIRRNQRLSAMGEMAASLAHRLRTPLATALLYCAHLANPALAAEERPGFARKTLERLHCLERLIHDMLLFVKEDASDDASIEVSSFLEDLRQVMEPQMSLRGVRLTVTDLSAGATLTADRKALYAAVMSLLENALQACSEGRCVSLECVAHAGTVAIAVKDNGSGIEPGVEERMFEPFFTTRPAGTGLGLAIVRGVMESLGGSVHVKSVLGAGSEFTLRVPCAATLPPADHSPVAVTEGCPA
jgi:two-component system sensor histidine kinase FlrB